MESIPGSLLPEASASPETSPTLPSAEEILAKTRERQVKAGREGGRSRSDAKREAVRANLIKARVNRWKGREAAKRASEEAVEALVRRDNGQETVS